MDAREHKAPDMNTRPGMNARATALQRSIAPNESGLQKKVQAR
jgi:hypothetical protein